MREIPRDTRIFGVPHKLQTDPLGSHLGPHDAIVDHVFTFKKGLTLTNFHCSWGVGPTNPKLFFYGSCSGRSSESSVFLAETARNATFRNSNPFQNRPATVGFPTRFGYGEVFQAPVFGITIRTQNLPF